MAQTNPLFTITRADAGYWEKSWRRIVPKRPKVAGTIDRIVPASESTLRLDSAGCADEYMTLFTMHYGRNQ